MAGSIPNDINPNTTSGTDLSVLLNLFFKAVASNTKGTVRDPNLLSGGTWVDSSLEATQDTLRYMLYDGAEDLELLRVNKVSGAVKIGSIDGVISVLKATDDALGADLDLIKRRKTGALKTRSGDQVGNVNFKGVDDSEVDYTVARIRSLATEDVTDSTQGASLGFFTTKTGTAALVERMRLTNDGKTGIGTIVPDDFLHVKKQSDVSIKVERETDDALSASLKIKKARISGDGQTLNNDSLGKVLFQGEETSGVEADLVKIEALATQNTDSSSHGSSLVISTKDNGATTYSEKIKLDSEGVSINGQLLNDLKYKEDLLHGGTTHDLFSVDSSKFGAFTAEFFVIGISADTRSGKFVVEAVWNGTEWDYTKEETGLKGSNSVISLGITNDVAIFDCKYDNLLDQGAFTSGTIYLKITRHGV